MFHLNTIGTAVNRGAEVEAGLQTSCEWEAGAPSFTLVQAASVAHTKVMD